MHQGELKDALRTKMMASRTRLTLDDWARADAARTRHVLSQLPGRPGTAALYASRPGEPGTRNLIDRLAEGGWRILLPVLRRHVDWAAFESWEKMHPVWEGIPEPTGARLGASALGTADLVVVPCLAVGRDGSRLGTGGGWYDRALPTRRDGTPVVALARTAELLETVPTLPHDIRVDAVATETEWVNLARRPIMDG